MPEIKILLVNSGSRAAQNLKINLTCVSPIDRSVTHFSESMTKELPSNSNVTASFYPIIAHKDRESFIVVFDMKWSDKLSAYKFKTLKYYILMVRNHKNLYSDFKLDDKLIPELENLLKKPSKLLGEDNSAFRLSLKSFYNK